MIFKMTAIITLTMLISKNNVLVFKMRHIVCVFHLFKEKKKQSHLCSQRLFLFFLCYFKLLFQTGRLKVMCGKKVPNCLCGSSTVTQHNGSISQREFEFTLPSGQVFFLCLILLDRGHLPSFQCFSQAHRESMLF